ncbi:hypothetical protein ACHQM5_001628 [Ranunculus cassubicifolius]
MQSFLLSFNLQRKVNIHFITLNQLKHQLNQPQKLALQAIMGLQTLPRGNIELLCDTVVKYIKEICGYDRVMVYKFHEDQHGEVVSEMRRSYLGLHYPATDVPQAAQFLFKKKNRVRMICDTNTNPVPIIQSKEFEQPIILVNSTLRAPHDCHIHYMANMGSIASMVMSIIVNENDSMKLWGLVSCHHLSPRYLPFPVRYACQFIMQVFGSQLTMELQLLLHTAEKKILKTEALLCDMILKDAPLGIVTKSPNIKDLVSCNGVVFYLLCLDLKWRPKRLRKLPITKTKLLGATPTEQQIGSLTKWLLAHESELTVWSTDSLVEVGYPNAETLGGDVCGVVVAKITSKDFLFWFRAKTEKKEVRWGGAKHNYYDKDDDGEVMHPRTSFKVFLEVVKNKSFPWEAWELNAIKSLQCSMLDWGAFQDIEKDSAKITVAQQNESEIEKLIVLAKETVRLLETAIAPIFAVSSSGNITRWNSKIVELTGMHANEAIGKSVLDELVHKTSRVDFGYHLSRAFQGEDDKNIELRLKTFKETHRDDFVCIVANACSCKGYAESGVDVCFIGQDVTGTKIVTDKFLSLQEDYKAMMQILNPSILPMFVSDEHAKCFEWNHERMEGGYGAISAAIGLGLGQRGGYCSSRNKRIDMSGNVTCCVCSLKHVLPNTKHDSYGRTCTPRFEDAEYIRQEMESLVLYGDQFRLQQILSNVLIHIIHHTPTPNGCVEIRVYSSSKSVHGRSDHVELQMRYHLTTFKDVFLLTYSIPQKTMCFSLMFLASPKLISKYDQNFRTSNF